MDIQQIWKKMKTNCILIASNFASRSPYWLQIKIFNSLLFYLFIFAINLWHLKFVTADVSAVSLNNQHGMKRREQNFDKTFIWNQYDERLLYQLLTDNHAVCRQFVGLWLCQQQLDHPTRQYTTIKVCNKGGRPETGLPHISRFVASNVSHSKLWFRGYVFRKQWNYNKL